MKSRRPANSAVGELLSPLTQLMRWRPGIAGLLIGFGFAVVYFFLAFAASGAGHGTGIFFAAILPYGLVFNAYEPNLHLRSIDRLRRLAVSAG